MPEPTIAFMADVSEKVIEVGRRLLPEQCRMVFVPAGATEAQAARIVAQAQLDEDALYNAVRTGHLFGAGLDTFAVEPPEKGNPLFTLPNVIVTPHIAGPTWDSWRKRFVNGYANIIRVAAGERPLWVVPEMREMVPWWHNRSDEAVV